MFGGGDFLPDSTGLLGNLRYFEMVFLYLGWLKSFRCPHFSSVSIGEASAFPGPLSTREHRDSGSCRVKTGTLHLCPQLPGG